MNIRYYNQNVDSAIFNNRGWRGFYIRVVARLVWRLQRHLEYHILRLLIKEGTVPPVQARILEKAFFAEDRKDRSEEEQLQLDRDLRYIGRKHSPEGPVSVRTNQFFARYADVGRAGTYRYGRRQRLADPDGDLAPE